MDGREEHEQREEQDESKKDRRPVKLVFCPDAIINCTAAGFLMALITIVCLEVGMQLYQRGQ